MIAIIIIVFIIKSKVDTQLIGHYPKVTTDQCGVGRLSLVTDQNCFRYHKNSVTSRIHNGQAATQGEVPFVVRIQIAHGDPISQCSGNLINNVWGLTAAHCVFCEDEDPCSKDRITIHVGYQNNLDQASNKEISVSQIEIHPGYMQSGKMTDDLALIKLSSKIKFTKSHEYWRVNSICLPKVNYTFNRDELGVIAGWGATKLTDSPMANMLQLGWVRFMATANEELDDFGKMIVVKRVEGQPSAMGCFGDSGGPLFKYSDGRAVLIGVTAGSIMANENAECPAYDPREAVLYSRVSIHVNWITKVAIKAVIV